MNNDLVRGIVFVILSGIVFALSLFRTNNYDQAILYTVIVAALYGAITGLMNPVVREERAKRAQEKAREKGKDKNGGRKQSK